MSYKRLSKARKAGSDVAGERFAATVIRAREAGAGTALARKCGAEKPNRVCKAVARKVDREIRAIPGISEDRRHPIHSSLRGEIYRVITRCATTTSKRGGGGARSKIRADLIAVYMMRDAKKYAMLTDLRNLDFDLENAGSKRAQKRIRGKMLAVIAKLEQAF